MGESRMIKRTEELERGCKREFRWIHTLDNYKICGQIEDLKHSDSIILCHECEIRLDERKKADKEFLEKIDELISRGNDFDVCDLEELKKEIEK